MRSAPSQHPAIRKLPSGNLILTSFVLSEQCQSSKIKWRHVNRYFAMNPSAAREDFTSFASPGTSNSLSYEATIRQRIFILTDRFTTI
jgi:hypothetical protein